MFSIYFSDLVAVTLGRVVIETANLPITELTIDSRGKIITQFPLFFAIVGINHDGHHYLEDAYDKGVRQFVVGTNYDLAITKKFNDVNILQVPHTLEALQRFTAFYRSKYQLPVLGITGSNGKTTVKEWIHDFLSRKYKTVSSPRSYNSQVGVPISLSLLQPFHEYAIFEAGISTIGEMEKLALLIQPTHGLFTNIGPAHSQGFQDLIQKIEEKVQLFTSCSTIYYCKDHKPIHEILQHQYGTKKEFINWSSCNQKAHYFVTKKALPNQKKTAIEITSSNNHNVFLTLFQDNASIENIIHCLVYLLHNGFDPAQLQCSLLHLKPLPMRMTLKAGMHRCQIIDDTYTNDLASLKLALDFMHQQQKTKQTLILSDILQSAMPDNKLYQEVAALLSLYKINRLIGIGPVIRHYAAYFSIKHSSFFSTVEDFMKHKPAFKDEIILVKGARTFRLERIVQAIEKNTHGTILEIDMHAIRHNLSFFKAQLKEHTKIMAITKATAYGNGSNAELFSALQRHGVAYLGVAYVDEGIHLRHQGITLPIMIMNPVDDSFDAMVNYNLEPEIYSLELLDELCHFVTERSIQNINIHLKLETGMHRLGITEQEINQLVWRLKQMPNLHIMSIFSHLASADTHEQDAFTLLQVERFLKMAQHIETHLAVKPLKHLLNSNGILRFPQFQFDMVRLGIGLYGVGVSKTIQSHLLPTSKLKTTILQVKPIKKGASIGYHRKSIARQDMTIATIPIGFADGFSRLFSCGKGRVVIQDHYCPIIGAVCMDLAMVDVTDINAKRGDEVIIFSAEYSVDELAERIGTVSYELFAQIGQRVKRIYYT